MFSMKIYYLFIAMFLLVGCSQSIDVPKDNYGLLLKMGKIEKTVSGPATIEKGFIFEQVKFISKKDTLELARGKFVVHYSVKEPERYYQKIGSSCQFYRLVEKELARYALDGKVVNTHVLLFEMIEGMGLPIVLDKVTDVDVEIMEL
jgi:hypothetical protein